MPKRNSSVPHPERDDRILYIFAYFLSWLSGVLMFITVGQTNKRMKFHAIQAIMLGIASFVIGWVPLPFFNIAGLVLWLYGLYVGLLAYEGRDISIPMIGEYALKHSS